MMGVSGVAIASFHHVRGETITFALRADPPFDGTETVTCDVKAAVNGSRVPPESEPSIFSITPVFVAAAGGVAAHWLFTIPAEDSAAMPSGNYITDARMAYADETVDYPLPVAIRLAERVTA